MNEFSSALSVLTAMITPAVLISACGALILSTSTRMGRVVDRVRVLAKEFEELANGGQNIEMLQDRQSIIFYQLDKLTSRSRLLQRSLTVFYLALGVFVSTSVAIGVVAMTRASYYWIPVVTGLIGACFLFYGSILLIFEARLALRTVHAEMDFLWRLSQKVAPAELVEKYKPHHVHFRRHV